MQAAVKPLALLALALCVSAAASRELLGESNHKYADGDKIELYANKVGELLGHELLLHVLVLTWHCHGHGNTLQVEGACTCLQGHSPTQREESHYDQFG